LDGEAGEFEEARVLRKNDVSNGGCQFFTNQVSYDLLRCLSGSERFGGDVFNGKFVQRYHLETLPGSYTSDGGVYLGRGFSQQLVQIIGFFFGHGSHEFLLILVSQHTEAFTAPHGVKNMNA
jgi:hypothetical protein